MLDGQPRNCAAHSFGGVARLICFYVVEDRGELLTPIASEQVERTAHESLYRLRDAAQCLIARKVSVAVVVGFEMIDIDQQDAKRAPILDGLLPQANEIVVEDPPVLGPGQRIMLRQIGYQMLLEKILA